MSDSVLQVDQIIDKAATTNKELAPYASGNWSWGSGVPAGTIIQTVCNVTGTLFSSNTGTTVTTFTAIDTQITPKKQNSRILIRYDFGSISCRGGGNLGYGCVRFNHSGISESDVEPIGAKALNSQKHHLHINITDQDYLVDNGASCTVTHLPNTTNQITYHFKVWTEGGTGYVNINQSKRNASNDPQCVSSCTIMELAV